MLKNEGYKNIQTEQFDNVKELLSEILILGLNIEIKRGLFRNYEDKTNSISTIKGQLNISDSIKIVHVSDYALFVHRLKEVKLEGYRQGIGVPALFISVLKNRDYSSKVEKLLIPYETSFNRLSKYSVDLT